MANNQPGTTNADAPFQPGEVVEFCGERFLVRTNYGDSGSCRPWPLTADERFTTNLYWVFQGEPCRRTGDFSTLGV